VSDRAAREREHYDAEAAAAAALPPAPYDPDGFGATLLDHAGPLHGARVLDLGCGAGDLAALALGRGARVSAIDLSPAMVEVARSRVGEEVDWHVGAAEATGLAAGSFDVVVGKWVLHHTDVAATAAEVARLLRPGGRVAFYENQGTNPLLRAARRRHHPFGTADERPLERADVDALRRAWGGVELHHPNFHCFELVSSRALGYRLHGPLRGLDRAIHRGLPPLRRLSYHVIVVGWRR
jgi:SAM-dependent methyltransferase